VHNVAAGLERSFSSQCASFFCW